MLTTVIIHAPAPITIAGWLRGTALIVLLGVGTTPVLARAPASSGVMALGRALYFDTNLSRNRTQACATCHDPARAFTDPRDNGVGGAASRGDDGRALGDRQTPSTAYAGLTPPFRRAADGEYEGGEFLDGRAVDLEAQAEGPLLNPIEMAMPDAAAVLARVRENTHYVEAFAREFGADVLSDPRRAFAAVTAALAAFQRTPFFAPFDSRYDRYLRGEYTLTPDEDVGRRLFFSSLLNCASCHVLHTLGRAEHEPFTNYRYHNVGVPPNHALRAANGRGADFLDRGLGENPAVADAATAAGKFKVPTLRNVAVTAPYMHNGVFRSLRTAVHFYNQHIVLSQPSRTNPETGVAWDPPEIRDNLAIEILRQGQPLDDARIDTLIAFLRTLTDRRYEPLLEPPAAP